MKTICNLEAVDWTHVKDFILQEGFYLFGGFLEGAMPTNDLWILKSELENLRWIKGNTLGQAPEPRYQQAMIHYPKENAIIISGGRNDKIQMIYSDLYFLALDTLTWIKVDYIRG